jgi:predicted nucleotidyltransferase
MLTEGNDRKNEAARTAALAFADALASVYRAQLGERLLGAYLIGSLAHGGFSHRYSDIDMALITEDGLDTQALTTLRAPAAEQDAALSQKLSVFWADRHFSIGRLPPLDRADYLDHAIAITERERVRPARPTRDEIRAYLKGAPFSNWTENTERFAKTDVLAASDHKGFIRTLLYPARLLYSWTTERMASNDEAVAFTCEQRPPGVNTEILTQALAYRQAGADVDALFPAVAVLRDQVKSCIRFMAGSASPARSAEDGLSRELTGRSKTPGVFRDAQPTQSQRFQGKIKASATQHATDKARARRRADRS